MEIVENLSAILNKNAAVCNNRVRQELGHQMKPQTLRWNTLTWTQKEQMATDGFAPEKKKRRQMRSGSETRYCPE
jgi:hypothetical protein